MVTEVCLVTYLEVLSNFTDKPLERKLADEELSRLLVPSDFTKGDSSGTEPVGLLNTTSGSLKKEVRMNMWWVHDNTSSHSDDGGDGDDEHTWAVFLAALVASCLRGALPE